MGALHLEERGMISREEAYRIAEKCPCAGGPVNRG
jgi:hypothetical protein